jgi:hypothetical protein
VANLNTSVASSLLKYTFTDSDGEVLASFRMNPADVKLAHRAEEVAEYFKTLSINAPEGEVKDTVYKLNEEIEDKICYLLGYDVRDCLFGVISATAVMADGNMFVETVMDKIASTIAPEIQKRQKAMDKAVNKHTAKYK